MSREVILNNKQLDVMTDDDLEITYENPLLQSVSDFKMSYTNTYTLPLTARNRAIFKAINDVNAETAIARKYHTLYEYRDGIPVIEDARVDIKNVKPRDEQIDIEVIWGALKSISDELGKENINDLPGETIFWGNTSTFLSSASTDRVGFLYFYTIQGVSISSDAMKDLNMQLPSVRVDHILDLISNRLSIPVSISDNLKAELSRYWIPCLTMKVREGTSVTLANVFRANAVGNCALTSTNYSMLQPIENSGTFGDFMQSECNSKYHAFYFNRDASIKLTCNAVMSIPGAKIGDVVILAVKTFIAEDLREISTTKILLTADNFSDTTFKLTFSPDAFSADDERFSVFRFLDTWHLEALGRSIPLVDGVNCTIQNEYLFQLADEVDTVPFGNNFDAIYNLPKISQIDFLKDILALTGAYVYFQDGVIHFDYVDSVLSVNALNIEGWLATREPDTVETEYDDFAQKNIYKYLDDDSIIFDPNASILIADDTLEAEKEAISLKFGASNTVTDIARIEIYNPDDKKYIVGNLKPRIIEARQFKPGDSAPIQDRLIGTFSSGMWWRNILTNKYKLVKSILAEPRVIEVEMYLQMGDLYKLKTNDLYYFWGSNWIMIDITVSTNGGATGKFIQLN